MYFSADSEVNTNNIQFLKTTPSYIQKNGYMKELLTYNQYLLIPWILLNFNPEVGINKRLGNRIPAVFGLKTVYRNRKPI